MNTSAYILFVTGIILFIVSACSLVGAMAEMNYYASRMSMYIFLLSLVLIATSVHMVRVK
jgi:hypothetical protein